MGIPCFKSIDTLTLLFLLWLSTLIQLRNIEQYTEEKNGRIDKMDRQMVEWTNYALTYTYIVFIELIDSRSRRLYNLFNRLNIRSDEFCASKQSLADRTIFFLTIEYASSVVCYFQDTLSYIINNHRKNYNFAKLQRIHYNFAKCSAYRLLSATVMNL